MALARVHAGTRRGRVHSAVSGALAHAVVSRCGGASSLAETRVDARGARKHQWKRRRFPGAAAGTPVSLKGPVGEASLSGISYRRLYFWDSLFFGGRPSAAKAPDAGVLAQPG